jgi:hypothetical protein
LGRASLRAAVDVVARGRGAVLVVELEQVAAVLGDEVDGAVLQRLQVDVALADARLVCDLHAVGLESLAVDLHEDLGLAERGRADGEGVAGGRR